VVLVSSKQAQLAHQCEYVAYHRSPLQRMHLSTWFHAVKMAG
jgi:hypothetical protein